MHIFQVDCTCFVFSSSQVRAYHHYVVRALVICFLKAWFDPYYSRVFSLSINFLSKLTKCNFKTREICSYVVIANNCHRLSSA